MIVLESHYSIKISIGFILLHGFIGKSVFAIAAKVGTMHQMEIAVNTVKQLLIDFGLCCDARSKERLLSVA